METKKCNVCKLEKIVLEFNTKPGANGKRYYNYACKACQADTAKLKNLSNKLSQKTIIDKKLCNKCNCEKTQNEFTKNTYLVDGLSYNCKLCQAQYYLDNREIKLKSNLKSQKKNKITNNLRKMKWAIQNKLKVRKANQLYYKKNSIKINKYNSKWAKENVLASRNKGHRYRVKKRNNTIQNFTKLELEQRMSVFGLMCSYCGGNFGHIDHVKPISKGGYHCLSNLRPSCKKCNLQKHNKSFNDWKIWLANNHP